MTPDHVLAGHTPSRRTVAAGAFAGAAALLLGTGLGTGTASAAASRSLVLRLPAPTGPHAVGATVRHLVDPSRNDPWAPAIGVRELMVTVFRPAASGRGLPRLPQLTPAAADMFTVLAPLVRPALPAAGVDWAATLTHARTGAPPLPGRRPVLVYSPGGGDSRALGGSLAIDLASHGWTVVTVDHPGDASEVEFPDERPGRERVRTTVLRPDLDAGTFRTMIDTRVADLRFVLDVLGLDRVGLYGHSAGGTAVAQALHEDPRVAAAVNLEGYLDLMDGVLLPVAREGTDRPLLLAGTDGFRDARLDRSWSALLRHGGPVARRQLADSHHWVFTDYAALVPQLRAAGLTTAAGRAGMVGTVDPRVSVPAVRKLVRSFFARHLPLPGSVPTSGAAAGSVPGYGAGHRHAPGSGHAPGSAPPARWGRSPQ
ncbi:alpha/beta fold hydrolase [Streptomyces sp. NPDC006553]|uniref:alpha/beta fold hydrolase n=1 Tax=unclassified Streptomyces TaxID=2593676 RepID=UPI002259BC8F|nr:alpha/beta fold hydrolase [Streptomyces sp. NBC_00233]MCX5226493.1 alpha/beta fold hydrolase [Streptomyces sp. NBC_00233]